MSEAGTQIGIARTRAGAVVPAAPSGPRPALDEATVHAALAEVMDPELPMVSIVDLGMIGAVEVAGSIDVELLPTYVGCPALELIRGAVTDRLARFGRPVTVRASFETPVDVGPHHAGRPGRPRLGGDRATDRCRRYALPAVRVRRRRPRQPVRPDAVPIPLLLPLVPAAVRSDQAGLTWGRRSEPSASWAQARWGRASGRSPWRRVTAS